MYQSLFELCHQISQEYGVYSPLILYEMSFCEVIDLFSDIRRMQIKEKRLADPDRIIMKPATTWF